MSFEDDADFAVFFDADDFGSLCRVRRPSVDPIDFSAIVGERSDDLYDDHLRGQRRELLCPTSVGLERGDRLEVLSGRYVGHYRIEDVERRNDGAESRAVLVPAAAAVVTP